jgi:hypothetical protein
MTDVSRWHQTLYPLEAATLPEAFQRGIGYGAGPAASHAELSSPRLVPC